jgi:hypothetical protein
MHMTEIGGQLRQQALHVGTLAVPAHQTGHGIGVALIPIAELAP